MMIDVLIDVSGSMSENGKDAVVKYLLYAINSYIVENTASSIKMFQWGQDIHEIESTAQIEFGAGKATEKIADFLCKDKGEMSIVITDGGFSRKIKNEIKKMQNREYIYYIGVGCDCNLPSLRNVADLEHIYNAQDIITCLKKIEVLER